MRALLWSAIAAALLIAGSLAPSIVVGQDRAPEKRDPEQYRLRMGDEVEIVVFNGNKLVEEIKRKVVVPASGDVSFPPIGKIRMLDRTLDEVQQTVAQKLKDDAYLTTPNVGCVVTHFEPRQAYLTGAVRGTIDLPIDRNMRILEVFAKTGLLGAQGADFAHVKIRRNGADGRPFPIEVNVDDILEKNQEQQNVIVFESDIIYVPKLEQASPTSADWVYVLGKVKSPGRQPIVKGRTVFTLTKLIALCGDFQEFADRSKIKIIRVTPTGREPTTVDFDDIIEGKRPDFELKPDDLVYVPETWI